MNNWISNTVQIFKIPELRSKILFVLGIFVLFRLMANIPIPGIDQAALTRIFDQSQLLGLLNLFTGGSLDHFSLVMLGLGPYITAVIVLQLLTMIFPALERLYKEEGEQGREKFNQYGRLLTVPFALLQGYGFLFLLKQSGVLISLTPMQYAVSLVTVTAGTVLLMWLGELISEKGIGNGVSLLIFAGIIARFPSQIQQLILHVQDNPSNLSDLLLFLVMAVVIIAGVVYVTEARRNIPVSYAKRVRGMKMYGGTSTYLPLSVNPAGVIPIIFALSILTFPGMIAQIFQSAPGVWGHIATDLQRWLSDLWIYGGLYFFLVIVFTFFYTAVTFDPKSIATNLQKMGGFVPGVRPGTATSNHLTFILNRVLLVGAIFLGAVAVMPFVVQGQTHIQQFSFLIGGTSLLIIVSVILETMRQMRAQLKMRDYESF